MQLRKEVRVNQFQEVQTQIQRISSEIAGHSEYDSVVVNGGDLSLKKLEEHQHELKRLRKEKVLGINLKKYFYTANMTWYFCLFFSFILKEW